MSIRQKILRFGVEHIDALAQTVNKTVLGEPSRNEAMSEACRAAAVEGIVLLKNDGTLPLSKEKETAFFGRVQNDYFYVGYGSGGDVNPHYRVSPMDAMRSRGVRFNGKLADAYKAWSDAHVIVDGVWGLWPTCHEEMPLTREQIADAAKTAGVAVVFIGRAMGESMDNRPKKGYYYLTDDERSLLDRVTAAFPKTVAVIDAGNIIDMAWVHSYGDRIGAVLYAFQGGMESGNALADVLYGDACPSGKLTDTIALSREDYPAARNFGNLTHNCYAEDIYVGYRYFETFDRDRVLYPFGFGLSYAAFRTEHAWHIENGKCVVTSRVTNTGTVAGAEVVQVYVNPPQGRLGKPLRNLVAFRKTGMLAPGAGETVRFEIDPVEFASYDDSGTTGYPFCYVLEPGSYELYAGTDVRSAALVGTWETEELTVTRKLASRAGAAANFKRLRPRRKYGNLIPSHESVPKRNGSLKAHILANLPEAVPVTGDRGIRFRDVCDGKAVLDDFVAQLDIKELDAITRGEGGMNSALGAPGNAGVFGGTTESLRAKGVPPITATDGPSGIRLSYYASLLPCGTALACSWNPELVERLGKLFGAEMAEKGSDVLLGPGMNIHRDPLCGRNFEYFSEDPHISGKIAAAMVRGIQSNPGRSACPKHFACNNQERMRSFRDSRLSERALREIYLKGFEICVKEGKPLTLMTSYNKINGVWGHYHYELVTDILRGEWGYEGLVVTDWWMQPSRDPDFPKLSNDAYRVRAQVDVLMPGGVRNGKATGDGSLEKSGADPDGITLGEMQRCAGNVLKLCMKLKG